MTNDKTNVCSICKKPYVKKELTIAPDGEVTYQDGWCTYCDKFTKPCNIKIYKVETMRTDIDELVLEAWDARQFAHPWKSGTKVGCAIETDCGSIRHGWNIEGLWQTSIHAEVCAITKLSFGKEIIKRLVVVAKTEFFTPCGACIDWIFQFGSPETEVIVENKRHERTIFKLKDLCPHYPKK